MSINQYESTDNRYDLYTSYLKKILKGYGSDRIKKDSEGSERIKKDIERLRQDQYKNSFKNTFDSYRITGRVLNKEAKCKDPALRCCE